MPRPSARETLPVLGAPTSELSDAQKAAKALSDKVEELERYIEFTLACDDTYTAGMRAGFEYASALAIENGCTELARRLDEMAATLPKGH